VRICGDVSSLAFSAERWRGRSPRVRSGRSGLLASDTLVPRPPTFIWRHFRTGLRDPGYVEGRDLHVEFRFSGGDEDRLPGLAAELVGSNVGVTYAIVLNELSLWHVRRITLHYAYRC
jgi:hypothetical protein